MKCIQVEYYNAVAEGDNYSTTYELFNDIEKAFNFAKTVTIRWIRLVDANNTYFEDDQLNYEDRSDTIIEAIPS